MATVKEHYREVLSNVYSWMFGGFDNGVQQHTHFFKKHDVTPRGSASAIDLGAGCGFQSIPLARAGYAVTAIDTDAQLLEELKKHAGDLSITPVVSDLVYFDEIVQSGVEIIVCMTDTILHLQSAETVSRVFIKIFQILEPGGRFFLTFRDLTFELTEAERFIPIRSDDNIIFTCFLEYEPETVKVHDLVYKKVHGKWNLSKSFYRKLRLSEKWVREQLSRCGFGKLESIVENGVVTFCASK